MPQRTYWDGSTGQYTRCASVAGLDSLTAFTLIWRGVFRDPALGVTLRLLSKEEAGTSTGWNLQILNTAGSLRAFRLSGARATTSFDARTVDYVARIGVLTTVIATYDETDGPRIFTGYLGKPLCEDTYVLRTVGVGATSSVAGAFVAGASNGSLNSSGRQLVGESDFGVVIGARLDRHQIEVLYGAQDLFAAVGHNSDLKLFWDFNQSWGPNASIVDLSGNGFHGTVTGATYVKPVRRRCPAGWMDMVAAPAAGVTVRTLAAMGVG